MAVDPSVPGPVSGVDIEGHDIVSMTDQMMRDMLAEPALAGRTVTPHHCAALLPLLWRHKQ
jgi:hypothetical protein